MHGKRLALTLLLLTVAISLAGPAAADLPGKRTDRLVRLDSELPGREGRMAVWVHFRDKGVTGAALSEALAVTEAALSDQARTRRSLTVTAGNPLVTEEDLPVAPSYLEAVTFSGAALRRQSRWLNAVSCDVTPTQLALIEQLPFVTKLDAVGMFRSSRVELSKEEIARRMVRGNQVSAQDKNLEAIDYGYSKIGLDQIAVPAVHAIGLSGAGVTVAFLDTGFNLDHEAVRDVDVVGSWDFVDNDSLAIQTPEDPVYMGDHGTGMLSLVAGYSPGNLIGTAYGASVILARTEDLESETPVEEDNWIAALEWAEGLGVDVVCSGIGYYDWYDFSDLDGTTCAITVAADLASSRGVCVVNSVGNEGANADWPHLIPPADGQQVIAVGAVDLNGFVAPFTSPGPTADGRPKPDILAQGVRTHIAFPIYDDVYLPADGSDYSAALIAGVVALMKEGAPGLTPAQVGQALRETASRSLLPDNHYGWGVSNALAAVGYWAPSITHTPLTDTEVSFGRYYLTAEVASRLELDSFGPSVIWRANGGNWLREAMTLGEGNQYTGSILGRPAGTQIDYYILAGNSLGFATTDPAQAPGTFHSFMVGPDETPPTLIHYNLPDQAASAWPPVITVQASDNIGVSRIALFYAIASNPYVGPIEMESTPDGWVLDFPIPSNLVVPGMPITYFITAFDESGSPNTAVAGPYNFMVVADRGKVLMVADRHETQAAIEVAEARGTYRYSENSGDKSTGVDMAQWLADAGYEVEVIPADEADITDFRRNHLVFVTCGSSVAPLAYENLRQAMLVWNQEGGRMIVEGGEVGYSAEIAPELADIRAQILHMTGWGGDDGRDLGIPPHLADHPFHHRPYNLPVSITVGAGGSSYNFGEADVIVPDDEVEVFLQTSFGTVWGGIIAYDNNTCPDAGQTIFMPFDLGRLQDLVGERLLLNTMTYLSFTEPPGTASISGRVRLAGRTDHSGVTVSCDDQHSAVTASDGSYTIEGLWGSTYEVTANLDGFIGPARELAVVDGEMVGETNFYLLPVFPVSVSSEPDLPIPDNDPAGVTTVIEITDPGTIGSVIVNVDISHFAVGNLVVTLTSPSGTTVTLHDRSGGISDDLVGSWPDDLSVSGPGSLADFQGEPIQGTWALNVADVSFGATGRINSWGLDLMYTPDGISGTGEPVPGATRLLGNVPNPFNPRTTIKFELAAAGPVQLGIFDLRGRLVARLGEDDYEAGSHSVIWNGIGADGTEVASGVYFSRLVAAGQTQVHKMLLVR